MPSVLDAFVKFIADTTDIKKALGPGGSVDQTATAGAEATGKKISRKIGDAAKVAFTGAGAAGGVLFIGAVEAGVKFEDQLRTINTVARLSDDELAKVGDQIQGLSRETGKTTDDLSAGFYDLVSAGVSAQDAIGVLRDSAKLATGALGTTAETVDLLTSVMNAYGLQATDSTRVSDIFAKAVADGKVTAAELGNSIAQIAPIAASAGISIEEVASGFAFLTAKGVPASAAATQMRAAISALLTPNEQLNSIQEQTGINFAKLAEEKGLAVALEKLREVTESSGGALDKLSKVSAKDFPKALKAAQKALGLTNSDVEKFTKLAGKNGAGAALSELATQVGVNDSGFAKALGSIEAYGFSLATTGANAEGFAEQITETADSAGTAQEQYEEKSKSASEQGKRFSATISTLLQDLGGPFVGTLGGAVSALGDLGTGMLGMAPIAKIAGGAIGGAIGFAVPKLILGLTGLAGLLGPIVTTVFAGLGTVASLAIAAWPVLLLAAVVAAVVFLINNPEIVAQILAFAGSVLDNLLNFLGALPEMLLSLFSAAFSAVAKVAPGFVAKIAKFILTLPFRILDLQVKMLEFFAGIGTAILAGVLDFVVNVVKFILSLPGRIVSLAPKLLFFFAGIGKTLIAEVGKFIGSVVDFFLKLPDRIAKVGIAIVRAIINGMSSLPGKVANIIGDAFRNLKIDIGPFHIRSTGVSIDLPSIPGFATGSPFIREDMLAQLSYGEIVVKRKDADAIRQGQASLTSAGLTRTAGGGGDTYVTNNNNVSVDGLVKARDSFEIATAMDRLTNFRHLTVPQKLVNE